MKKTLLSMRDKTEPFARRTVRAIRAGLFTDPHPYPCRDTLFESIEEFTRNAAYFVFVVVVFCLIVWAHEGGWTP